uniref:DNA-damage-repair/toleration protein DRT100 family n=1 Tax=Cajanus cajan TaxID=3821 RepID=A0A151R557_CAJCA|nr:DNA-damage-repair/toleration protein DRT100 family [Cajanus cajan]
MNWWIILSVWLLTLGFGVCREIECIPSERETLMKLKHHLTDPSNRISSWNNNNANCCHWRGVVCNNVTAHVLELHLNTSQPDINDYIYYDYMFDQEAYEKAYEAYLRSQIGGEINPCLADMKHLNYLDLSGNNFEGIQNLSLLQNLGLFSNSFSSSIPNGLYSLRHLKFLNLQRNNLNGSISNALGNLTSLVRLDLSNNQLEGKLPTSLGNLIDEIGVFKNIVRLDFSNNSIGGSLPRLFGNPFESLKSLSKLSYLEIRDNHFEGVVKEDDLSNLTKYKSILGLVTNIDLSNNNLSGGIPREITYLDGLIYLNLSNNQLTGQIPPSVGNMRSLESMDISKNQLSGEIPPTIANLSFLNELDVSYNHLKGQIPTGTQIQSFEASYFVGNFLCGPPLTVNCSSNKQISGVKRIRTEDDGHEVNWFFVSMTLGFVVGFCVVVTPLFIYKSWRYVYFCFLDGMWYKMQSYW